VRIQTIGFQNSFFDAVGIWPPRLNDPHLADQQYNPNAILWCDCADTASAAGTTGKTYRKQVDAGIRCWQNDQLGGAPNRKYSDEISI
jgi:hypothetical protein